MTKGQILNKISAILAFFVFWFAPHLKAATLDLNVEAGLRFVSYKNLSLSTGPSQNQAFFLPKARLSFTLKDITFTEERGRRQTMAVGLVLNAVGIAGSTTPVKSPFDRAASRYPNDRFLPFISEAYLHIRNLRDTNWNVTVGRQPFTLGSGLVVSDDGLGFTGLKISRPLPWKSMKATLFFFQPKTYQTGSMSIDLFGASLKMPLDGQWHFYSVCENDRTEPTVFGTIAQSVNARRAFKNFSGVRYALDTTRMSFDGEVSLQSGSAVPSDPAASKIKYKGTAFIMKGEWKQDMRRFGQGSARVSIGHGSGDNPATPNKDEAFFPGYGHRYEGIERSGFGEFFGASLYDAFGGSTTTATGFPAGLSGIQVFSAGATLPTFLIKDLRLDLDFHLFKADRTNTGSRSLGREWDISLRYSMSKRLFAKVSMATFSAGSAISPAATTAKRVMIEVFGRF